VNSKTLLLSVLLLLSATICCAAQSPVLQNGWLAVRVRARDGAYEISSIELHRPALFSRVGAEVNGAWLRSSDYPRHQVSEEAYADALGRGRELTITFSGLPEKPDLVCTLILYQAQPYGTVSVAVRNSAGGNISVEAIRVVDAVGEPRIALGTSGQDDRVLAESFSEDPTIHIGSLSQAPHGLYRGVRNVLIYDPASKDSLLFSALTTKRFLTVSKLRVSRGASQQFHIASFTVDSTGTTESVLGRDPIPPDQQVKLSLPVAPGQSLSSERVMFAAGRDYLQQLERYGRAVRRLHHLHFSENDDPIGWWSWTAFYGGINQGEVLTNARWLAAHLKSLGYNYLHIDEGYDYARGEYATANATQFPDGMWILEHRITSLGLVPAIWTAPFEVSERAWVYEHHKDWLVHDAHGKPIFIGYVGRHSDRLYVLDTTNPEAQAYLRRTYRIMTRQWGIRYIKMDFMDSSAIEGYYYRPHTTALEAQRVGLEIIRQAVGPNVLLDKDGSVMLNPVGYVNEGRIAPDTGHSFSASKGAAPNIAARFYMNGNFFISDPDAFSVSRELEPQQHWHESHAGLNLSVAQVQIVLAALAGGMYEIGDDLPTLGSEQRRLALVENQELIDMNRLGRAALPLDLMTFRSEDEEPSVFFLREDRRQAMLAVFNWSDRPLSHAFNLASLGLPVSGAYRAYDVLNHDAPVSLEGASLAITDQTPHSVRLIKLDDDSIPAGAPAIQLRVPATATGGESVAFAASSANSAVPAISYHWIFGDGTAARGKTVTHTYTHAGSYSGRVVARGVEGLSTSRNFSITVTGYPTTRFNLLQNRRYTGTPRNGD
jgi:alpha-galactosidase